VFSFFRGSVGSLQACCGGMSLTTNTIQKLVFAYLPMFKCGNFRIKCNGITYINDFLPGFDAQFHCFIPK
jgi:hypothetical protein